MYKKIVGAGTNTQAKVFTGARKVCEIVSMTLGPGGRSAIIQKKYKSPHISNDGVTVARHIVLDDEIEDLGAQVVVEACLKTNDTAGDGTTTTACLAGAILNEYSDLLIKGNPVQQAKQIKAGAKEVIELIKQKSRQLTGEDLVNVAITSMGNEANGRLVAEMVEKVGKDGYIAVEDNWLTKYDVTTEMQIGVRKLGTYASPYFATNARKEAVWENTRVLICNDVIENQSSIEPLLKEILKDDNKNLVIISGTPENAYSNGFIISILGTIQARNIGKTQYPNILLVKAPSLTSEELEDVAVYCDAKFIDKNKGMKLKNVSMMKVPSDLGFAKKIVVNENEVIITGGAGNVKERVQVLQEQLDLEKDMMFKKKLERRIADISSGVGIIRVGASTEQERTFLKEKFEDAKNAAKAALEEGVVKGGGLCLKEIAEQLGKEHVLYNALYAPSKKIAENMGESSVEVSENTLDAAKVVRLAVQNACSIVSELIPTEIAIGEKAQTLWDMLDKKLNHGENTNFREDENIDIQSKL